MRSLERARESWQELQHYHTLRDLKDAVRLDSHNSAATAGLRSLCWKTFVLFDSLDPANWQRTLTASRSAYNALRTHLFRYIENPNELDASSDPLTHDAESSPWAHARHDDELRAEIKQDVDRCMPETPYFRLLETQRMLLDILFVFCKLNPDVGYRQGMHEIAAPILWVVNNDAVDIGESSKAMGEDGIIKTVFDAEHIEHDTFAIFGQVMQSAKTFYLSEGPLSIAARSRHIFNDLLPQVDPELMKHLESLDIVPQVFLIRWIRLLFGREFDFEGVLTLWDVIFAEDSSLEIVDHICLAMLLRIRWHLLDADYNAALTLLLKYPEQDKDFPAQTLGLDGLYLQNHMSKEGGSYLVLKYTGRPLPLGRPTTPPALQRNITTFSGEHAIRHARTESGLSPNRGPRQARHIETMLQNTAKNIYARGEKLGIGKVVRNAVDEVHKKAQEIRDSQIPSPKPSQASGHLHLLERVKELEIRNKRLSELLSGAVNELWEFEKLVTNADGLGKKDTTDPNIEKLSAAIAKVQFVQVYLEEPSLALAEDDNRDKSVADEHDPRGDSQTSSLKTRAEPNEPTSDPRKLAAKDLSSRPAPASPLAAGLADPSTFDDFSDDAPLAQTGIKPDGAFAAKNNTTTDTEAEPDRSSAPKEASTRSPIPRAPRPPLDQSPFSFMLGQDIGDSPTDRTSRTEPARGQMEPNLFSTTQRSRTSSKTPLEGGSSQLESKQTAEEGDFDLGSLRRARVTKK